MRGRRVVLGMAVGGAEGRGGRVMLRAAEGVRSPRKLVVDFLSLNKLPRKLLPSPCEVLARRRLFDVVSPAEIDVRTPSVPSEAPDDAWEVASIGDRGVGTVAEAKSTAEREGRGREAVAERGLATVDTLRDDDGVGGHTGKSISSGRL